MLNILLSSRTRAEVFRLLFGLNGRARYLREIQRHSGVSLRSVQEELEKLVRLDLVERRRDGNRVYFEANRAHPLFVEIHRLVLKTAGLVDVLRIALKELEIQFAFVYGSVAKAELSSSSDVDLMIIGTCSLREVVQTLATTSETIGREVNPFTLTVEEFTLRMKQGEHFITSVVDSPKLFVIGRVDEFGELVGEPLAAAAHDKQGGSEKPPGDRRP